MVRVVWDTKGQLSSLANKIGRVTEIHALGYFTSKNSHFPEIQSPTLPEWEVSRSCREGS